MILVVCEPTQPLTAYSYTCLVIVGFCTYKGAVPTPLVLDQLHGVDVRGDEVAVIRFKTGLKAGYF